MPWLCFSFTACISTSVVIPLRVQCCSIVCHETRAEGAPCVPAEAYLATPWFWELEGRNSLFQLQYSACNKSWRHSGEVRWWNMPRTVLARSQWEVVESCLVAFPMSIGLSAYNSRPAEQLLRKFGIRKYIKICRKLLRFRLKSDDGHFTLRPWLDWAFLGFNPGMGATFFPSYRGTPSPAVQRPGREADRSFSSIPEVKNERSYTSTTPPPLFAFSCMLLDAERFDGYFVKRKRFGIK
jgi:hypothetical protein